MENMMATIEKDALPLYPFAPQYEYVIKDNGNRYGVNRTESGYDLYLIDNDNIPIADGRNTQEWNAFYQLGWTKQELHNGIKEEWKSSLLPPLNELEKSVKELYGEQYQGERIEDMDMDELENLYEQVKNDGTSISKHDKEMMAQDFSSLEELSEWEDGWQKNNFAHVKLPAAFLHPHTMTAKDGREFDKAFVSFPKGTKINGVDIGGFRCDVFISDRMKQQLLEGGLVTLSFKGNEPVSIWTGKKDSEQYPYKQFQVKPWDLVKGIKQQMQDYKDEKESERQGKNHPSNSLSSQAKEARTSSNALANKDHSTPTMTEHYK